MITREEVQHIAKLARLGLTEKEIEKHQKEFLKILDYIEKLKEVDVCRYQIPPSLAVSDTARPAKNSLHSSSALRSPCSLAPMRKDEVLKFNKKLIDGHLKVKSIL